MAATVIILEVVLILADVTCNSAFSILMSSLCEISFLMITALPHLRTSTPGAVVGMHSVVNVKSSQFDV